MPVVVLHSSLSEVEFKGLANEESYAWKRVEQVMNEARNKLGSNSILEYKVCVYVNAMMNIHGCQHVVWPKVIQSLETRNESSERMCVHELAKSSYEDWLRNMGSGDMESRPSSAKFKFPKEARNVYAFLMSQVRNNVRM